MEGSFAAHYQALAQRTHFTLLPERSREQDRWYQMLPEYGSGYFRQVDCGAFTVLITDFTPKAELERLSDLTGQIIEISYFDTESNRYRVGRRGNRPVHQGILCHLNNSREQYATCEAGKPTRFVKLLITQQYLNDFLLRRYGEGWRELVDRAALFTPSPRLPELVFIFRQIRSSQAVGISLQVYLEGKVLEILAQLAQVYENREQPKSVSIRLTRSDRRWLAKSVSVMKRDLAAYPSIGTLAAAANMSESRFQLAFKQVYGTTPYAYLQDLRMNRALQLLHHPDDSIGEIAAKVGYRHAGHFSGLFKTAYGLSPREYRERYGS